jgi:hypothetical protein
MTSVLSFMKLYVPDGTVLMDARFEFFLTVVKKIQVAVVWAVTRPSETLLSYHNTYTVSHHRKT